MENNLHKVVIVTGAASGIGLAVADRFLSGQFTTILVDQNQENLEKTVGIFRNQYHDVSSFICDLRIEEQVKNLIDSTVGQFGRLDALVNCAGISPVGSVTEINESDFRKAVDINLISIFLSCKHAIPYMISNHQGVIVNIVGTLGSKAIRNKAAYCASKGGALNLTQQMALDYGDYGIRVNAVSPGYVDTPLNKGMSEEIRRLILESQPLHQATSGKDIAEAVFFLCSDAAAMITGTNLTVDAGQSASQGSLAAVDYWSSKLSQE